MTNPSTTELIITADRPRKTYEELEKLLAQCPQPMTPWVHYKTGQTYLVHGSTINEATLEPMVIYAPVNRFGRLHFSRPLSEWNELVEYEGQQVPRFRDAANGARGK